MFDDYTPSIDPLAYAYVPASCGPIFDVCADNAGVGFALLAARQAEEDAHQALEASTRSALPHDCGRSADVSAVPAYQHAAPASFDSVKARKAAHVAHAREVLGYVGVIRESGWCYPTEKEYFRQFTQAQQYQYVRLYDDFLRTFNEHY